MANPNLLQLCHLADAAIERNHPNHHGSAVLFDCDGEQLGVFPGDWTDGDILFVLQFANKAYAKGYEFGGHDKARQIRAMLEI